MSAVSEQLSASRPASHPLEHRFPRRLVVERMANGMAPSESLRSFSFSILGGKCRDPPHVARRGDGSPARHMARARLRPPIGLNQCPRIASLSAGKVARLWGLVLHRFALVGSIFDRQRGVPERCSRLQLRLVTQRHETTTKAVGISASAVRCIWEGPPRLRV